jgi:hypothetical protein
MIVLPRLSASARRKRYGQSNSPRADTWICLCDLCCVARPERVPMKLDRAAQVRRRLKVAV